MVSVSSVDSGVSRSRATPASEPVFNPVIAIASMHANDWRSVVGTFAASVEQLPTLNALSSTQATVVIVLMWQVWQEACRSSAYRSRLKPMRSRCSAAGLGSADVIPGFTPTRRPSDSLASVSTRDASTNSPCRARGSSAQRFDSSLTR